MDRKYNLDIAGEIRFGLQYFELEIQGVKIPKYYYGFCRAELEGGRYLSIEEWLTTDYQKGSITRVAIFYLENGLVSRIKTAEKGFVSSFKLANGVFSYRKEFHAKGQVVESDLDWSSINNWEPTNSYQADASDKFPLSSFMQNTHKSHLQKFAR